ncbi:dihydroneopterin aldolase [Candidatus Odyssella acanthamoebae]|uniref:dihydroneopterin aldolase n=1 Tax=Candidatus Odyssella acanthamoebae TaxID=91604 RepID=UPI00068C841D|nr:dihydroneopterin aldolase [Candidatus Paracaedibacter acanthamoebae]
MTNMITFQHGREAKASKHSKTWDILIKDLVFDCFIGINAEEALVAQAIRLNLKCRVEMPTPDDQKYHGQFVCYDQLIRSITVLAQGRHTHLVETLAEDIAQLCFENPRITKVWCCVEKLDVYSNASSVGVEIERYRDSD